MKYSAIKIYLDKNDMIPHNRSMFFLQNDSQIFLSLLSYNYETSK
jgi:hypothetical protein